jgi:hypothetical protein
MEANMKLGTWALVLAVLSNATAAFAQFRYSNCRSADQNTISSGFLDATSVLMTLKVVMIKPPLKLSFSMISPDGTKQIPINPNRGISVAVPFHDGQKLVYQADVETADLFDADAKLLAHLDCAFGPAPIPGTFPPKTAERSFPQEAGPTNAESAAIEQAAEDSKRLEAAH